TEQVSQAIIDAHSAYIRFKGVTAYERAQILYKVSEIMKHRKEELVDILILEAGKPKKAARAELDRTIETYILSAEEAKRITGETVPMDAAPGVTDRIGWTKRESLGVVTAITPFNFPFNLVAHKLGPAFAVGNAVVLKPASQTPLSSLIMAEIFKEAGLPDGMLQIITGSGSELSQALVTDSLVRKVTFTGSSAVGLKIKEQIGLRKITLELGSNAGTIIEPNIPIAKIVKRCVEGAFTFSGQVCISLQRIYVHKSIIEEFKDAFVKETLALTVGDPNDERTDVSAMINPQEVERIKSWIALAEQGGAKVEVGGAFSERILTPTVMSHVTNSMKIVSEETFAPIVSLIPYDTLEDAIALLNSSTLGLNASIFTTNLEDAMYAADEIEAGAVIINDIPTFRTDHMPYGGVKLSGYGREGIKYAIEEMSNMKFITIKTKI
ncbi:MAG: aldehyde dehydrogenase family protein, partial [Kurthia sp.]